ncbi:MAG: TonB family protein [Bryobacteraceae bacterium]
MEWKQWEGRVIDGDFHLRQYLGGSAHSAVFLTEYGQGTPQKAVIKLIPADSGKAHAWMLRRELAARLSHPGLLSIVHFGTCQLDGTGLVYVVMEHAEEDLSQVIPIRPLAPPEAREMLVAVQETLAYVHANGFVHGCLTPTNIMAAGDRIKISSDGLLRIGESSDDLWERNPNGAPESRDGIAPAGDVWSLGMMLVEALTQRAPAWDPAGTCDPVVPEHLETPFLDIARRCLRSDPRSRCSLEEIALALQPASSAPHARPGVAETVPVTKPAVHKAERKRQYLFPVAAVAILGVLIFTGVILMHALRSPGTEPRRPEPSGQAAVQEKPETVPAAPVAKEVAAPSGGKTSDALTLVPTPPASGPATDNSAERPPAADVVDRFVPEVPPQILGTIRGRVTVNVKVSVDRSGSVVDAELESRAGSKYFDRMALQAARRWRFRPASDAGNDGESTRRLRFEFRTDGCVASLGQAQH